MEGLNSPWLEGERRSNESGLSLSSTMSLSPAWLRFDVPRFKLNGDREVQSLVNFILRSSDRTFRLLKALQFRKQEAAEKVDRVTILEHQRLNFAC